LSGRTKGAWLPCETLLSASSFLMPVLCVTHLITPCHAEPAALCHSSPSAYTAHPLASFLGHRLPAEWLSWLPGSTFSLVTPEVMLQMCQVHGIFENFTLHSNSYLEVKGMGRSRIRLGQKNAVLCKRKQF